MGGVLNTDWREASEGFPADMMLRIQVAGEKGPETTEYLTERNQRNRIRLEPGQHAVTRLCGVS